MDVLLSMPVRQMPFPRFSLNAGHHLEIVCSFERSCFPWFDAMRETGLHFSLSRGSVFISGNSRPRSIQKDFGELLAFHLASCANRAGSARCCSTASSGDVKFSGTSSLSEETTTEDFISKFVDRAEAVAEVSDESFNSKAIEGETGGGGGGGGGGANGNNRGYGGGWDDENDNEGSVKNEDENYGPFMSSEEVCREAKSRGITLPADLVEASRTVGIETSLLFRYFQLQQGASWPLGSAVKNSSLLRNRMLADPSFLFKLLTEVAIDASCATFAEVQRRGKDFWNEFELYASDLVVGIVLDIALVFMLAPFVQFGGRTSPQRTGRIANVLRTLPSSMFEAERPGRHFTYSQRIGTLFVKGAQYGVVGFICGFIGQGIASSIMTFKRRQKKTDSHEVAVPPLLETAALWAVFMGVSSNTRYQIVNGLERVVEGSLLTKHFPHFPKAFTIGIRFANNIYGGMQFVDWARWAGVQ